MDTIRLRFRYSLLLLAVFLSSASLVAAPLPKEIDEAQRRRALALNDITGDDPIEGQINILTRDLEGSRKLIASAVLMAREKTQPFNYNAAYILARVAEEQKDVDAGRLFYQICAKEAAKLKSSRKIEQAYFGLIDFLTASKKYEESEKVCKELLEMELDGQGQLIKQAIQRRMIQVIAKQGKTDEAMKLVDNYIKARKGHWFAFELKGSVQRELGQYAEAAKTYEEVVQKIEGDQRLEPEERDRYIEICNSTLSNIYLDMKNVDKAVEVLRKVLAKKPDDPGYNNDLGYIMADHDMNLDEAEKMIRKALDEDRKRRKKNAKDDPEDDKDNSAYLDSLGWVLYKQKKYKEAKEPLLKAVQDKEGQHIEIYDHLAEVHKALGEEKDAIAAWKKGVEAAGDSKREQERKALVEKKLKAAEKK